MPRSFYDDKWIYSVDMMIAYINIYKPKHQSVDIEPFIKDLHFDGWGDPANKVYYSAMDVIKNPKNKKYRDDMKRIEDANLYYPIIIHNDTIIDGIHRLSKAYLLNKKKIKAYIFTKDEMNKFVINKKGEWNKVDKLQTYDIIKLFHSRFC